MEKNHLLIGGIVLVAAVVLVGIFAPSGFLSVGKGNPSEFACVKTGTSSEICEGASDFWHENTWGSRSQCETVSDEAGRSCGKFVCSCKNVD
jgi:hypothetical protein|tara:strand:+ start:1451 stop:1726 length:276 start_codon:yes stop_codon:yes gene_type:complete